MTQLQYAKQIRDNFSFDITDTMEVMRNMDEGNDDFEVNDYRFINKDEIDKIQTEELESDPYILGCFNASFLSGILGTDTDAIEAIQNAGAHEGLGKMIISGDHVSELQQDYASMDGYGHHFSHYDGEEHEVSTHYAFRTN